LTKEVRTCYWFNLLVKFSRLLRYEVTPDNEVRERRQKDDPLPPKEKDSGRLAGQWIPVDQYLATTAKEFTSKPENFKKMHGLPSKFERFSRTFLLDKG
jgi:hypothetical protein